MMTSMIPGLHFGAPGWLWLLPVLPVAVWYWNRGKTVRFRLLSMGCLTLLLLAASKPELLYEATVRKQLLLWENTGAAEPAPEEYDHRELRSFTGSTAAALAAAAADIPDGGGSILLVGTLQETDHALDAVLETLTRRRIAVTARPPATGPEADRRELRLRELTLPPVAGVGATVPVTLELDAATAGTAHFAIQLSSGETVAEQTATFTPGPFRVTLALPLIRPGSFHGRLEIDGIPSGELAMQVREAFRAVLFSRDPERELPQFQAVFGDAVRVEAYRPGQRLDEVPLLIFGPGVVPELSESMQRDIIRLAGTGTGLLAVAGREAVFTDEVVLPEFAQLFPVRYPETQENRIPTVALAVVIDTSGSMRGPRLDLARETARLAIAGLQEHDLAGIVEFHGTRRWAAPLQSAANQFSLMRALNRLNAGGGTVILPAVHEAYYALRNTDARLKHLLIITDGGVEYGDFETIIRKLAQHDITVSTVQVGPGESDFLSRLALWGGGRFYRASSRFALPELQFREQENRPHPPIREGELTILPAPTPLTSELPPELRLGGLVQSVPMDAAEILLRAGDQPLLAVQQNAPGRSAVWNSEWNGSWSAEFLRAPEAAPFLCALARSLPDPLKFSGITAWNRSTLRDLDFEFETADSTAELKLQLTELSSGRTRRWRLAPSAAGTFRLRLPGLPEGVYRLQPENFQDSWYFVSRRAPAGGTPDLERIDRLNRTALPESAAPVPARYPLSAASAALAAVLFLAGLAWRRRGAVVGLLLLGTVSLHGATFAGRLRQGLEEEEQRRFDAAARCYRQSARLATSEADRTFAEILARETARRSGAPVSDPGPLDSETPAAAADPATAIRQALRSGDRSRALALYAREIAAGSTPEALARLSDTAAGQGLFGPAEDALRKALAQPTATPDWTLHFQLAALYRRMGQPQKAVAELQHAIKPGTAPAAVLQTAGDLCEQAGAPTAARDFYRHAGTEDALLRLARLEQLHGSFADAVACWRQIAAESGSELRARQAIEQLVELYRRQNRLPELLTGQAPELPESRRRELRLRALVATGDRAALYAFLDRHGTPDEALQYRLIVRDYAGAATLLQERLNHTGSAATQARATLLRQLALVAVELKDSELATTALEQLLKLAPADASLWEFSGAIRLLSGDPAGAAVAYDRALKLAPEKSELLLLWGKARGQAGESAAVLAFFTAAYPRETNPERFGILIDGLLNFNAPRQTLQEALQEVLRRLHREPETLFYYQLAEDLAGELGDHRQLTRLARLQMIVAPERRTLLTQNCFLDALQAGERDEALFYGRLLLAYDEIYPPELTRALGELLVENRLYQDAERCLRNADRTLETDANLTALAAIHADAGNFFEAERLYRELLALAPNRIELLESYARMLEFQGRIAEAAEHNFQALRLRARASGSAAVRDRALPLQIRTLVNQALYQAEVFRTRIDAELQDTATEAGRRLWRQVRSRLDELTVLPDEEPLRSAPAATAAPPHTPSRPDARHTLNRLRTARPEQEPELLRTAFAGRSGKSREFFWRQLVAAFDFEPSATTTEFLLREMTGFTFEVPLSLNWSLPFAGTLKSAYAEAALARQPEALATRELAARMRHLAGDGDGARALAEICYDQLEASTEPLTITELRRLLSLNQVYADAPGEPRGRGRAALHEQLARQDEKRELLGDTPFRQLLGGILRYGDGRYDEAQEFFARAWDADRDAFAVLWLLNQTLAESGAWESWLELLLERVPNDQTARTLYTMAVLPRLRHAGREREARKLLPLLNPALQRRERLLLARYGGDPEALKAALLEFLHAGGGYRVLDPAPSVGGILEQQSDFRSRAVALFAGIVAAVPSVRPFLDYRLQGLLPYEAGFAELRQALRNLPEPSSATGNDHRNDLWPAPPRTPAQLLQEAADPDRELSAAERAALRNFARHDNVEPEVLTALLAALPETDRLAVGPEAVKRLLRQALPPSPEELELLFQLFPPELRRDFCAAIAPYDQGRDAGELRRLRILHRYAPERVAARLRETDYPPESMLSLLAAPTRERCRNYLLLSGATPPDWRQLRQLMSGDEALTELTDAFCAALAELAARGSLSWSQQVRHYALLAVYDAPSRRPLRLRAARQAHCRTGEASLWLLDALLAQHRQEEAAQLTATLRREGKLPPARRQPVEPEGQPDLAGGSSAPALEKQPPSTPFNQN